MPAETLPLVHGGRSLPERALDVCARGGRDLAISRPRCGPAVQRVRALADAGVRSRRPTHRHFPASARESCDHFRFPPEKSETGLSVGGRLATLGDGAVAHRACVTLLRAYNHPRITALDSPRRARPALARTTPLVRLRSTARIFSPRAPRSPSRRRDPRHSEASAVPAPSPSGRHRGCKSRIIGNDRQDRAASVNGRRVGADFSRRAGFCASCSQKSPALTEPSDVNPNRS